jgi:DNA-binding beta-propeller fold protein YncE
MSVDDCCNLQKSPHDVCYISNEEAVVTYEDTFVDIVSIGNPRKSMKRINLPYTCFGIICDNSKFITTDYSHNVHIYDLDFNNKTTVSEDIHGSPTFSESRRIAVSDNGDRLFVTDSENGVVILENNGSYIKTIKEQRLSGEDGICTDRRGNIFLCGYHSNNVVQISEEGESFGVILRKADGIVNPQSVCFNPSNNTLFISLLNNDVVKVFELK